MTNDRIRKSVQNYYFKYSSILRLLRSHKEIAYRFFIHRIINLKKRRLCGKVVLKQSIRFDRSAVMKFIIRYRYWKNSDVPITVVQSSLNKIEEFGHIPVRRRPISTDRPTVLVGAIAHKISVIQRTERTGREVLHFCFAQSLNAWLIRGMSFKVLTGRSDMWPHLKGCRPIAKVMYFCLDMQEKVARIEQWLQVSSAESARVGFVLASETGSALCHCHCGWFTWKMQERRKEKCRVQERKLLTRSLPREVCEEKMMVNAFTWKIGRNAHGDASRKNKLSSPKYM